MSESQDTGVGQDRDSVKELDVRGFSARQRDALFALYAVDQREGKAHPYDAMKHADRACPGHSMSPGTIYPVIERLESAEWAIRRPDLTNLRAEIFELTPDGRRGVEQFLSSQQILLGRSEERRVAPGGGSQ